MTKNKIKILMMTNSSNIQHTTMHLQKRSMTMLTTATSTSINFNSYTVFANGKHKHLTCLIKSKRISIKIFCWSKAHKIMWTSKEKFNVANSMWAEINLDDSMATSPTTFYWKIPTRHVVSTDYDCAFPGDACLTGFGAHCPELKF